MEERNLQIEELVVRILEHKATTEEIVYFSNWIKVKNHREYFEQLKKIWNLTAGVKADEGLLESGLKDYCHYIDKSLLAKRRIRWIRRIASVAAVLILAFSTMLLWPQKDTCLRRLPVVKHDLKGVVLRMADNQEIALQQDSLSLISSENNLAKTNFAPIKQMIDKKEELATEELSYNEIIVPAGERFIIQLSDGTKAWINSESSLRFPVVFGKEQRLVEARGNVYFEVTKDTTRPFVVETREMKVEVLGTSFEINTYGDRGEISATLVSGAVHVSAEGNSVIMSPNQQLIYDLNKGVMKLNKVDALRHVRWKDGVLVINNERFDDLVWKLERWYGVSIINRTGLKFNQLFSGEFDREDIQHAIKTICVNLNISYIIEKEEIYLIR